jgi:hypothetical protein
MHKSNPEVVYLAKLIDRTPSSVAMKLVNFASLDPAITGTGRSGLGNASAADRAIWNDFHDDWEQLALESKQVLSTLAKVEKSFRPKLISTMVWNLKQTTKAPQKRL